MNSMADPRLTPLPKLQWDLVSFLGATTLLGLIGTPIYFFKYGFTFFDFVLFVFYVFATGLSITMGYHRLFAHQTYKAHPIVQFFLLFFGAAAFEQPALRWASQHRTHHFYSDEEVDPYGVHKGFFHAHVGWLLFWERPYIFENAKDLQRNRLLMHQNKYYGLWAIGAGIILPVLIGAMAGRGWAAFWLAVCFRIFFVHHSTFCINSVCHYFGKKTYDLNSSARDHWIVALLTFGEGYHNFHHRFPGDYRNGVRWYHWDPSKWLIKLLRFAGLASDLKTIPQFRILHARLHSDSQRAATWLEKHPVLKATLEKRYAEIIESLRAFELATREYQKVLKQRASLSILEFQQNRALVLAEKKRKRAEFKVAYQAWLQYLGGLIPA